MYEWKKIWDINRTQMSRLICLKCKFSVLIYRPIYWRYARQALESCEELSFRMGISWSLDWIQLNLSWNTVCVSGTTLSSQLSRASAAYRLSMRFSISNMGWFLLRYIQPMHLIAGHHCAILWAVIMAGAFLAPWQFKRTTWFEIGIKPTHPCS